MSKVFFGADHRTVMRIVNVLFFSLLSILFVTVSLSMVQAADNDPKIGSFSGPTELKTGEDGVWKISASDESKPTNGPSDGINDDGSGEGSNKTAIGSISKNSGDSNRTAVGNYETGSNLTYRVDWGDENVAKKIATAALTIFRKNTNYVQKTSFTHSYKKSGEYKITLTVRDADGNTAKTTTTVKVTEAEFVEAKFSAKPDSGKTPLEVVFRVNLGTQIQARIDFGDGSDVALVECDQALTDERAKCDSVIEVKHTYVGEGSYKATLFKIFDGERRVKDTLKIRVKTGNPLKDFFNTITDAFQGSFDTVVAYLFPDDEGSVTNRDFANLPDINTDEYRSGTRTIDEIEAIIINDKVGDKVGCNLSTGSHTFQAYVITNTNEIGISDCSNSANLEGYLTTLITNLTLRHAFSGLKLEEMKNLPIYMGGIGEDLTEVQDDSDTSDVEEDVNRIGLEVKVKDKDGKTVQNWIQGNIKIRSTDILAFRWDAREGYTQCLPFLADNGTYALTRTNAKMLTANTENEGFNINERAGAYYVECERNGDKAKVHTSVIEVTVNDDGDREVQPPTRDQYSIIKSQTESLTVTLKRNAPAGCSSEIKYIGEIDWGDGNVTKQPQVTTDECRDAQVLAENHTYKKAGNYHVSVKLNGLNVMRQDITVKEISSTSGALKVTPTASGSFDVKLTTNNSAVNNKITECTYAIGFYGASGNGLTVDWGDGNEEPGKSFSESVRGKSCTDVVSKHTYKNAGSYNVKLKSWHPGPTDAPITDWEETAKVTIGGSSEPNNSTFSASPQSGNAELKVNFEFPTNVNATLTFGDKSKSRSFSPCTDDASGKCATTREVSHTFIKAGVYTARLITGCPIQAGQCSDAAKVETVVIRVK